MVKYTELDWDKVVVYDIETMVNCFCACFRDFKTGKKKTFTFFDDEKYAGDPEKLLKFLLDLKKKNYTLVGFNSLNFDSQVLEYFIANFKAFEDMKGMIDGIYSTAQEIIALTDDIRFKVLIPESKLSHRNIDLFKQKHYDGKAKMGTSLKWLQFSMRYPNIEEMPFSHDYAVNLEEVDEVVEYCWNDVDSTADFFGRIKFETELRVALSKEYGVNLLNASEPRIAKTIFAKLLCDDMGITWSELKEMKTFRKYIKFNEIIFPYVSFYTTPFQDLLNKLKGITVDASPGSTDTFKHNFTYKGVSIDLGLGGIHGCITPGVYEHDEEYMIYDIDAKSFYPNLAIRNGLKPEHLGESFNKRYEYIYDERISIDKKDPRNYVYKIILNSTYGLSKEINSYIYDPQFTYGITINGQLTILMLTEMLCEYIKDITLIQLNTDGISIKFKRKDFDRVMKICEQFKKVTKQDLEYAEYSKMVMVDVNNYIAIGIDGKPKKKGLFETELDYHKNPSYLVVSKALENRYVYGGNHKDYINNSTDIYDFCGGFKSKSNFTVNLYKNNKGFLEIEKQQKVTRFYVAKEGGMMIKDYDDGRQIAIMARQKVQPLNKIEDVDYHLSNVDRNWYIKKTDEIVANIERQQLTLNFE